MCCLTGKVSWHFINTMNNKMDVSLDVTDTGNKDSNQNKFLNVEHCTSMTVAVPLKFMV